jgi:predicted  nucleic acid-binding Zn-ribbon protein
MSEDRHELIDLQPQMDAGFAELSQTVKAQAGQIDALKEQLARLQSAIYPGLPKWEPSAEQPKQDFFEAVAEDLRAQAQQRKELESALADMTNQRDKLEALSDAQDKALVSTEQKTASLNNALEIARRALRSIMEGWPVAANAIVEIDDLLQASAVDLFVKRPTEDPCKCGQRQVPRGTDGVSWYWQRHSREACTLELPDAVCPCGLRRSEHIHGHATEIVLKGTQ